MYNFISLKEQCAVTPFVIRFLSHQGVELCCNEVRVCAWEIRLSVVSEQVEIGNSSDYQ